MEIKQIWGGYELEIYHLPESPCNYEAKFYTFMGTPLIYIFAYPQYYNEAQPNDEDDDAQLECWVPVYIGETKDDLLNRMAAWVRQTKYLLNTTHIHLLQLSIVDPRESRESIEKELIQSYGPRENKNHNSLSHLHLVYDNQAHAFRYGPQKISVQEWVSGMEAYERARIKLEST